ncbi:MAG: DNA polymerase II [Kiritimatiellae bacterium]|nr:DNA polymerase II [Kiritimatiellia bacterium]
MASNSSLEYDPILYGANSDTGLVAIEHLQDKSGPDQMVLFVRDHDKITEQTELFEPFLIADKTIFTDCPVPHKQTALDGAHPINLHVTFSSWKELLEARKWLSGKTGFSPTAPGAPFYCPTDPIQQYLMSSGRTFFKDMRFADLRRMQVDIECYTAEGYEFCNPDRKEDRIIAIAVGIHNHETIVLSGIELDEKAILEQFVELVAKYDPDVIEGHNIFNFDLPYIATRAKLHKVKLTLGRDGSIPKRRNSRLNIAERTLAYERFDIYGRHIIDTLHLVQAYDVAHRSLNGFGLKQTAIHFGFASPDRTYIPGPEIATEWINDPHKVMRYVKDDIEETEKISHLLSGSTFTQAQILPFSYQNVSVRGNATKIDALITREYIRQKMALPRPGMPHEFAGGYTDMFQEGVFKNVHHCDVRSLYPTLMLTRNLAPKTDHLEAFHKLLTMLKEYRLTAKRQMQEATSETDRNYYDARQSTFKILINSFYGYLGFAPGRFNDFDMAEQVTADGRELLRFMIDWLNKHGASPIEIDTDGIYFMPPKYDSVDEQNAFQQDFMEALPDGIEVEFDGEYKAMYSYKMKNYALLTNEDEVIIKGAALKSRGLEPFQRSFLRKIIGMKLKEEDKDIPTLKSEYTTAINGQKWLINEFAKTETLQNSPASYKKKQDAGKGSKRAVYELALTSDKKYRSGDQLSYYVTGAQKKVTVYNNSKLVSDWDPEKRDENIAYYLGKLDSLYKKFIIEQQQTEFLL